MRKLLGLLFILAAAPCWSAVKFDGVDDKVTIASIPQASAATQQATFTAWIKLSSLGSYYPIIESRPSAGLLALLTSGNASHQLTCSWNNIMGEYNGTTGLNLLTGQWTFVACTINGSVEKTYRYSASQPFASFTFAITATNRNMTQAWYSGVDGSNKLNGLVDDIRIYNRALSDNELQSLAESRSRLNITDGLIGYWPMDDDVEGNTVVTTIDRSGNGNNATASGATGFPVWGSSDYINYP